MLDKRTFIFSMVAVLVASVSGLAAPIQIAHMSSSIHGEAWLSYLREMKVAFEAANPGYEVEIFADEHPEERFFVMAAGGAPPDVLDLATYVSDQLITVGALCDLNAFLDPHIKSQFPPAMLKALITPEGRLFTLPVAAHPVVTWYNLDLLHQAGLVPPAQLKAGEWTWERMREYGLKLTKDDDGDGEAEIWGLDRMWASPYIQVAQAGGRFFDREIFPTRSLMQSKPVVTAVNYILELIWGHWVTQQPSVGKGQSFYHGNAAINVVDGPGNPGAYATQLPFGWDVAPQPYGPIGNATQVFLYGFQISARTPHLEPAWQWVEFIGATEKAQRRMSSHTGYLPVMTGLAHTWDAYAPNLPANWRAFSAQLEHPGNIFHQKGMTGQRISGYFSTALGRVLAGDVWTLGALGDMDIVLEYLLQP